MPFLSAFSLHFCLWPCLVFWISFLLSLVGAEIKESVAIFVTQHTAFHFITCVSRIYKWHPLLPHVEQACLHLLFSLVVDGV